MQSDQLPLGSPASFLKVTPDLRGCPPVSSEKKIRMHTILKESTANYIPLESLINVDLEKKYELPFFLIPQKKIAKMSVKMTMRHSIKQMN